MDWRHGLYCAVLVAGVWQGHEQWLLRAEHPADGEIAPLEPVQTNIDDPMTVAHDRWRLTERAHYDITARILSREDYHFDALSDLIPEDLALGWGPMSDNRVLNTLEISQDVRFYTVQAYSGWPIALRAIIEHSANTHVIPADREVGGQLARLRRGQVVHLTGMLVDGVRDDATWIKTSMTRTDTGPGACEIMLVEQVEVVQ